MTVPPRHTASAPSRGPVPPLEPPPRRPPVLAPTTKVKPVGPKPPKGPPPKLLLARAKAHVLSLGREELTFARLSCAGEFHCPSSLSVQEFCEQAPGLSRPPFPPPPPPLAVPAPHFANAPAVFAHAAAQAEAQSAAGPPIMYLFRPGPIHISVLDSWRQAWVKLEGWL